MADRTRELKDLRIPIMMTHSEVAATDDWMFAQRLRSRSSAIRQLCAIALRDSAYNQMRADSDAKAEGRA